mgnify:CR=1 FL=1|jgi:hypothetical protein
MTYNPDNHYRCTIIRGKSQREMDDLLPAYAGIITDICPCERKAFDDQFNNELSQTLYQNSYDNLSADHKKTIRNHITEVAGKLLGLYWSDEQEHVYASESAEKLLADNDQPAFFKNLCLNFQFPNGSQKIQTVQERIRDGICFKPFHFIVTLLSLARGNDLVISKNELAFYVLSSLDVLRGEVCPQDVLQCILAGRGDGEDHRLPSGSYDNQHIKEQLNLLELANIIRQVNGEIHLNTRETATIQNFLTEFPKPLKFDIGGYDLSSVTEKKRMYSEWSLYYGSIHVTPESLATSISSLQPNATPDREEAPDNQVETAAADARVELGDAGELLVYNMEKTRVRSSHPRLENKVLLLGKQRGLGYDISSVEAAENCEEPEFARFIEVKSTKRTTAPNIEDTSWFDTINLTRKEWIAAKQYRTAYNIYRVYYTTANVVIRKITDPYTKNETHIINVLPTMYRMDFSATAIDKEYLPHENV